jgi:hypothetical protein
MDFNVGFQCPFYQISLVNLRIRGDLEKFS